MHRPVAKRWTLYLAPHEVPAFRRNKDGKRTQSCKLARPHRVQRRGVTSLFPPALLEEARHPEYTPPDKIVPALYDPRPRSRVTKRGPLQ
ncbi:hypothetical protein BaRGS_00017922 [Batillaria attramentaria]|uniref:Uncharacterized protein n=1 Tax=Batillaria attramentaria TaxID=370345 RepID=A0ABD0KV32_9CAEN